MEQNKNTVQISSKKENENKIAQNLTQKNFQTEKKRKNSKKKQPNFQNPSSILKCLKIGRTEM